MQRLHRLGNDDRRLRSGLPRVDGEAGAIQDQLAKFRKGNPLDWVAFKNPAQDVDQFIGQGQNRLEKGGILEIGTERGILDRGSFPRIASACQVDENDTQAPDVIGGGRIAGVRRRVLLLTLCLC